jgi:hypothetical protein
VPAGVTAGYSCIRGSQASESLAQTARSGMPGTPALTVSGLTGEFPGGRYRLAPQERGDQQPVAPACSRRLALVTAAAATTGAIMSAAASSVRRSTAGRRSGAGAGDQVTVTDSHHPALRMAPEAS